MSVATLGEGQAGEGQVVLLSGEAASEVSASNGFAGTSWYATHALALFLFAATHRTVRSFRSSVKWNVRRGLHTTTRQRQSSTSSMRY